MKEDKMKNNDRRIVFVLLLTMMLFAVFIIPLATAPNVVGPNYKNVTIRTLVNITNAKPEVLSLHIFDGVNQSNSTLITAGSTKTVSCNATVRDWDGFNDIENVQGVIWAVANTTYSGPLNNNSLYYNSSCWVNASTGLYTGFFTCSFDVWYHANNGTWNCTINVTDGYPKTGNGTNSTIFYPVYALNVTDGIDYGSMSVEETSNDFTANVTNLGNMIINVTVEGYARTRGDGLAMNCSISGNISVGSQRFGTAPGMLYTSKTPLTSSQQTVTNLTVHKQHVSGPAGVMTNATYWQLYIPPNPAGNCTGYILFTAIAP